MVEQNQQKPPKIGKVTAIFMLIVAIFFDVLVFRINFIPVLGQVLSIGITVFAYAIFLFWFILKGVKLMSGKKIAAMGGGFLVEIIPIVNMLPAVTFSVAMTILLDRKELRSAARIVGKVPGGSVLK